MELPPQITKNLHEFVLQRLEEMGIESLYPPQEEAILKGLDGSSVIVSIPTASGKTLIAEILAMNFLLHAPNKETAKVLYLAPLKALVNEKYRELKEHWGKFNIVVGQSTSDIDRNDSWVFKADVIVMTNEKADSLLRMNQKLVEKVGVVICDEIHLINDDYRGLTLEMLLTRLRSVNSSLQLIGLSATVNNAPEIAKWLKATLIQSTWRPVELKYGYYSDGSLVYRLKTGQHSVEEIEELRRIQTDVPMGAGSSRSTLAVSMAELTIDIIKEGGQSLIFSNTRRNTQSYAEKLAPVVVRRLNSEEKTLLEELAKNYASASGEQTETTKIQLYCLMRGVSFHHAGLKSEEKRIVEEAFRNRLLKCIVATPTLAAGVNVPARRVIIQSIMRYDFNQGRMVKIPIMEFHQMAGRAGRPAYDPVGEVCLLSTNAKNLPSLAEYYFLGAPEDIISKLNDKDNLEMHVIGMVASKFANTVDAIYEFIKKTLYYFQQIHIVKRVEEPSHLERPSAGGRGKDPLKLQSDFIAASELYSADQEADQDEESYEISPLKEKLIGKQTLRMLRKLVNELIERDFIERNEETGKLSTTPYGRICAKMYLKPSTATHLKETIDYAYRLENNEEITINEVTWLYMLSETGELGMSGLNKSVRGYLEHAYESFVPNLALEEIPFPTDYGFENLLRNLKPALILNDWISEKKEATITENYSVHAGDIRRYVNNSTWLLRAASLFANQLEMPELSQHIGDLELQVQHGCKRDLLDLVKLKGIGRVKARNLKKHDVRTLHDVLNTPLKTLMAIPTIGPKLGRSIRKQAQEILIRRGELKSAKRTPRSGFDQPPGNFVSEEDVEEEILEEPDSAYTLKEILDRAKGMQHGKKRLDKAEAIDVESEEDLGSEPMSSVSEKKAEKKPKPKKSSKKTQFSLDDFL